MLKKSLAIGIIFFLVISSVPYSILSNEISTSTFGGNILYVGGSGPGNYSIIQDAVDNASDGDTVFVYSGTYSDFFPENMACVYIEKNIELVGENKHNTIINGTGFQRVIIIMPEEVSVSGFTIQHGKNKKQSDWGGLGIDIHYYKSDNIRIFNNIITNNRCGIRTHQSSANIQIYDNLIMNNYCGIECEFDSAPLKIYRNIITNNEYGINTYDSQIYLNNNLITNNNIGVYNRRSSSNYTILQNEISDNEIGIKLDTAKTTIKHNNLINNENQVKVSMDFLVVFAVSTYLIYKQEWISNYWDDWNREIPKPIMGLSILAINIFLPIKPFIWEIPIGIFPSVKFDWFPAKEPYDISMPEV